ncbi:hypothetical protein AL544_011150 [Vibrio mimicus]|uniref:Uncharacterized protein n=1 Tax=Vibrio mimicus TaxID=674 RepID=A0A2J9UYK8_VIBMI|nr:hypothetical protein AL544_011150 [Vibrio mimicus]
MWAFHYGEFFGHNTVLLVRINIPFPLEAAAVLAVHVHPKHIVIYAHGDALICHQPATLSGLGIDFMLVKHDKVLF